MKHAVTAFLIVALLTVPAFADRKAADKRQRIDVIAADALERLFEKSPVARELYDRAYGYAVFDTIKVSLFITGGGGAGVAVEKADDRRTYMKMGTGGVNLGAGGQKYQVVFFFETKRVFEKFVEVGWQADASANAVAGEAGANAAAAFRNGIAVWQMTEAGLMLQADIAGTKYWKSKKLNR